MVGKTTLLALGLVSVVLAGCPVAAEAGGYPFGGACGAYGYAPWGYYGYQWGLLQERIPYFALNPPVYYSYPVPRSYGYSPYAYPPYILTPEVQGEAVTIQNPYVPKVAPKAPAEKSPGDKPAE